MSAYPVMIEGNELSALVVGGGAVATRKVLGLLRAGARVRVVAPVVSDTLERAAGQYECLHITRDRYTAAHLGDALLVVAATDDETLNAVIAGDARGRLINVVTTPDAGNCTIPAVHRAGDVVVAVSAGGVPAAAARIRDAIAVTIDARFATAVTALAALRRSLIDSGRQDRWTEAAAALVGEDFCTAVKSLDYDAQVSQWR